MITPITKETPLKSMQGINLPILLAQYWYSQHSTLNFISDLNHYLFEGQILSTPGVFVMGKFVDIAAEKVFFVRFACGDLEELVQHILKEAKWIAFCRNNCGNLRKYSVDRLKELSSMTVPHLSPIFSMHSVLEASRFRSAA